MSTLKLASEKNQRELQELVMKPGNDTCADCKARNPRWGSHNLGIFICVNCASIHRKIGTHITKVYTSKSMTMDTWTREQVDSMKNMGNRKSNAIFNPNETRNPPPPNIEDGERDSEMEQYIRAKYEYRKYIDRNALVASKLGPSRSSTSMTPRSVSSPARSTTLPSTSSSSSSSLGKSPLSSSSLSKPQSSPLTNSAPAVQPRPASQPTAPPPPVQQHQQGVVPQGGIWNDLVQLQNPASATASLPLQYQQTVGPLSPSLGSSLFATSVIATNPTGLGFNPFQQQQQQQQFQPQFQPQLTPSFTPSSQFTPSFPFNQPSMQPQSSFGQQLFMNQTAPQQAQFFQPQPQSGSLQTGVSNTGYITPSPSQGMMSAPVTQTSFMTPSPNQQFMSHSPQPTQMFMTPSPQLNMGMMGGSGGMQQSHSPIPGMVGGQFMGGPPMMQQQQQLSQHPNQFVQNLPSQMLSPANFQALSQPQYGRNPFAPM